MASGRMAGRFIDPRRYTTEPSRNDTPDTCPGFPRITPRGYKTPPYAKTNQYNGSPENRDATDHTVLIVAGNSFGGYELTTIL
jgi:hypothetical protein